MNPLQITAEEPFKAGTNRLEHFCHHLVKLNAPVIFFCRGGSARLTIDLKTYETARNTQIILLPNRILTLSNASPDFAVSFFSFSPELLREATVRFQPSFFSFLKEKPCYTLPDENIQAIHGLMEATEALYHDRNHLFRNQIVKNLLQSFLLEIYDKTYRLYTGKPVKGINRQEELFKRFITLVHEHYARHREVNFYAEQLCITPRYLSTIVQHISGTTAKNIINKYVILEIKALLQSSELDLQQIANQLSFPDQSFFGRYFKKHTGLSPLQYRKLP